MNHGAEPVARTTFAANLGRTNRRGLRQRALAAAETPLEPSVWTGRGCVILASVMSGVMVSVAWWNAGTVACAALGWVSALLLAFAVRARREYLPAYCCGLACCSLGFYWLYSTLAVFGGFGVVPSAILFGLYVAGTAVQFLVFAWVHHNLGPGFDALALRTPTALVLSEFVSVRLFHWSFGHTQVAFTPFAQAAGIGGAFLVSFLMFWLAEALVRIVVFGERRRTFALPVVAFGLALGYGGWVIRAYASPRGEGQKVVLVQGNAPLARTFNREAARRNVVRLYELSQKATRPGALIVWPEGAIPAFIPEDIGSAHGNIGPALPWFGDRSAFLLGTYAIDRDENRYNAAFAVHPDGTVETPYFKQVLIPFGEYVPFASVFPWLQGMNQKAGVFRPGHMLRVFAYPMTRLDGSSYTLKAAPLICYEDTVPALSREATRRGAELLVNLTYDTWFGRSAAAGEHHLIASFRAIENRRYLVRVTNSGLSAVVDPLGRTSAQIPAFTEGSVTANVQLLKDRSLYTDVVGERPWWALLGVGLGTICLRRGKTWRRSSAPG